MIPDINLLPEYERQSSILYLIFLIGLILCIILYGVLGFFYFSEKNKLNEIETELTELNEQKAILEGQLAALHTEEEDSYFIAAAYADHLLIPTSSLIDEFMELLPMNGYLTNYRYSYQSVEIDTQFDSLFDAASYFSALKDSDFVRDVRIHYLNAFDLEEDETEGELQVNESTDYDVIPRYDVNYTIDLNQSFMKEAGDRDE